MTTALLHTTTAARWHGVDERVLVGENAKFVGFFHQFLANAQGL